MHGSRGYRGPRGAAINTHSPNRLFSLASRLLPRRSAYRQLLSTAAHATRPHFLSYTSVSGQRRIDNQQGSSLSLDLTLHQRNPHTNTALEERAHSLVCI
eukprot:GHVU01166801.1.p1 GENE.GHVU01166801.1~~GHVU01166801.1.p1  ORF type:complete len:100 (-),score=3.63 GHVU01166801.1:327-626(-)